MSRRIAYIDRQGRYHRCDEQGTGAAHEDYYKGVAPSDLARLDGRQLYQAAERLHECILSESGTASDRANANEALNAVYTERKRRQRTIR